MTYLQLLEIFGSILAITGSILLSFSTDKNTKPIYFAFICFLFANLSFLIVFTDKMIIPVIIQMIFFYYTSINGVLKTTNNLNRDKLLLTVFVFISIIIYVFFVLHYINLENLTFEINYIEFSASTLAIIGSFLIASQNKIIRSYAFILFIIADIVLAFIGFENELYFFMFQSILFVFNSMRGYVRTVDIQLKKAITF